MQDLHHGHAFICGVPRSGTTALAYVLNSHPQVCIGIERYKFPIMREKIFDQSFFEKSRFFDFKSTDTNILPKPGTEFEKIYADMYQKWDHAIVTGDKLPRLYTMLDDVQRFIPDSKFIFILRNIESVASSWNARASNLNDIWPAENDYRACARIWNNANRQILAQQQRTPGVVHIVIYEDFFSGNLDELTRLCDFIGIDNHALLQEGFRAASKKYVDELAPKERIVFDGQTDFLNKNVNLSLYEELKSNR